MKKQIERTSTFFLQGIILLFALFGTLYSFLWSFELPVRSGIVNVFLILYVIVLLLVFSLKRWWIVLAAGVACVMAWIFYHANELELGAIDLLRQLLAQFNVHSSWSFISIPNSGIESNIQLWLDTQVVLLFLIFMGAFSGYAVIRRPSLAGLMLLTLPVAAVPLIFMIVPPLPALACLITAYVMLYVFCINIGLNPFLKIRRKSRKKAAVYLSRSQCTTVLLVIPIVLLSIVCSSFILPQQDYSRPGSIDRLRNRIDHFIFGNTLGGGLRMGNLSNLGNLHFTGRTVLKVKSANARPLYLRGYAGSTYNGVSWNVPTDDDYMQAMRYPIPPNPQNYYAVNLSFAEDPFTDSSRRAWSTSYQLSVKNLSSDRSALFVPNGLITDVSDLGNAWFVQDVYSATDAFNGITEYTLRAFPVMENPPDIKFGTSGESTLDLEQLYLMPDQTEAATGGKRGQKRLNGDGLLYSDFRQMQQTYRKYVYNTCTALPEKTKQSAGLLCSQYGLSPVFSDDGTGLSLDLRRTCNQIAALLSERCEYSERPQAIPEDKDFATCFLNESREGYCVHFATTAAILLRSMGIPARYAEGYVVTDSDYEKTPDSDGYIPIADNRAHAWVEVFNPVEMEWYPVEMTPSFSSAEGLVLENNGSNGSASSNPVPSTFETDPAPTAVFNPSPAESAAENSEPEIKTDIGYPPLLLAVLVSLIIVTLAAVVRRKAICRRRQISLSQENINGAVLEAGRWILAMLCFAGGRPPQNLDSPEDYAAFVSKTFPEVNGPELLTVLRSAQKARFSNKICTEDERQAAIIFGDSLAKKLSSRLSIKQRFMFCYIECLY